MCRKRMDYPAYKIKEVWSHGQETNYVGMDHTQSRGQDSHVRYMINTDTYRLLITLIKVTLPLIPHPSIPKYSGSRLASDELMVSSK